MHQPTKQTAKEISEFTFAYQSVHCLNLKQCNNHGIVIPKELSNNHMILSTDDDFETEGGERARSFLFAKIRKLRKK